MGTFDRFNAEGVFDAREPPFTDDEIREAADLRQRVSPDPSVCRQLDRYDRCPHQPLCASVADCIEAIAWYRRHQHAIEHRLAEVETT
jgi:hypothetical protein